MLSATDKFLKVYMVKITAAGMMILLNNSANDCIGSTLPHQILREQTRQFLVLGSPY